MEILTKTNTTMHHAPTRMRRLWMVIVLGALSALAPLSIDMYLPALPSLARDLHTSTSFAQLSLTASLLGLALGQLAAGPISDARGRRMPLLIGLIIYAATSGAAAATNSIWLLILLRLIQGLAGSAGIVVARAIVRDHFSGIELTKFVALLMLVNGAAPILAPIIGAQLLRFMSWHGVFVVLAILGALMLLSVIIGLPESLPLERRATGGLKATLSTMRTLVTDRAFMGFVWSQGLVLAAMFGYISGSPFVLQNKFGVSPQTFSLIFAANGLGIIIAGQLSARWSITRGEKTVLAGGLMMAAIASLILLGTLLWPVGLIPVLPPLFAIVASVGIVSTTTTSLALQNHGHVAGSASALIGVSGLLAGAAVTPLVGLGGSQAAAPMGIVIVVCEIGAVLCYIFLIRHADRKKVKHANAH